VTSAYPGQCQSRCAERLLAAALPTPRTQRVPQPGPQDSAAVIDPSSGRCRFVSDPNQTSVLIYEAEVLMAIRIGSAATRRRFLATSAAATAFSTIRGIARPFISRATDRRVITHGVQSGDVAADSGVVWARADRPARMLVEASTTESFKDIRYSAFVDALPESEFTPQLL